MRALVAAIAAIVCLAACGSKEVPGPAMQGAPASAGANIATTEGLARERAASSRPEAASPSAAKAPGGRSGELDNPDASAMVFLYYDLAGLSPPIDEWVERDTRVQFARPADKDAQRAAVQSELEAAAQAVRGVGRLRLSLDAGLSEYDPTYGEFTVRAFAPSSVFNFDAFGQTVSVRFGNGREAQLWRVDADEARAIRDRISYGSATLDAQLAITGVQPAPKGGTIVADVVEYELRESLRGQRLGRVAPLTQ